MYTVEVKLQRVLVFDMGYFNQCRAKGLLFQEGRLSRECQA